MSNADIRKAHKILDDLFKGNMVLDEEREFLRSFLPERQIGRASCRERV